MRGARNFIVWGLLLLLAGAALAAAHPAQQLVQDTSEKVLARLKEDRPKLKANPDLIYPLVEDLVLPHFDFEVMSRWVLGKNWREASEEQRGRFTEAFKNLLVRTYATALLEYSDQRIEYKPMRAEEGADKVTVSTEVVQAGGPPVPITYQLFRKNEQWKVYDITVDNVSLLLNYRNSYASEIRRDGLDRLIERMAQRNGTAGK